jgi:AcrR family transcriptional regulator
MTTTTVSDVPAVRRNVDFRRRLLDGLAASIEQRGYRDTTVADIVRHARTSKRTFYSEFPSKEDCFAELLTANNDELVETISAAVDPHAPWHEQVRQAVVTYVHHIDERRAITLSWIRELPALGEYARPTLRRGFARLATMIVDLSGNEGFRAAGLPPISHAAAVILVGGLRELTAQTMEDGDPAADIIEPALSVSLALLGPAVSI